MNEHIGKVCPYCGRPVGEGDAIVVCPACGIVHHQHCWEAAKGCTTPGCPAHYQIEQAPAAPVAPTAAPAVSFCPNCGSRIAEGHAFCSGCGHRVGAPVAPAAPVNPIPVAAPMAAPGYNPYAAPASMPAPKKKSGKALPIIIIAAIVVVALIAVVVLGGGLLGPAVNDISLGTSELSMRVGESQMVSYSISTSDGSSVDVHWESSDVSVARVKDGVITAEGAGTCTITVSAGGKSDSMSVTVKKGPDFKAIYDAYCEPIWATVGSDGSYLSIDTNPFNEDDNGVAYPAAYYALEDIHKALGLPDSLFEDMGSTSGADGKQTQNFPEQGITVSWKYHPDKGLEATYKILN